MKITLVSAVGVACGSGGAALATRLGGGALAPYRFFNDAEGALLVEICEQIIPRDDVPGATDAGVVNFIDRQLLKAPLSRHQKTYRSGLASFARTCADLHGKPFAELSAEVKQSVMRAVEAGKAPAKLWSDAGQQAFFRLVCTHTMQAFYGSPRHGGNRGYVSFRMLGLPYPQVIGQNR